MPVAPARRQRSPSAPSASLPILHHPHAAAALIGLSVYTLARWRKRNIGPPYVVLDNGRVAYLHEDLVAHLARRRRAPDAR